MVRLLKHRPYLLSNKENRDIGKSLSQSLVEEYSNEKTPTDGEVYWRVRQYETEQNENSRQRWFVRLSKNKQMRLDQLDNKKNRRLRQAFDKLLQIRGLWLDGLRISMFHRVIAVAANEVSRWEPSSSHLVLHSS
jgi:hypothetical protein